jgi:signal transduction histidine kinase
MFRGVAEQRGVTLGLARAEPVAVRGDAAHVRQVIHNLVDNAIKFTPPGGRVSVSVERCGDEVAARVEDDGIGIAPALLPRLFERFYKADRARAGSGTGLGLAIAKHLVQAQGGRIWAESAGEGQGATFVVALPAIRTLPDDAEVDA